MNFSLSRLLASAACAAVLLAACGRLGDPVDLRPVDAPRIAYDSLLTFTVGAYAERTPASTGGPILTWSVSPALPSGLSLGATGAITGLPSAADTGKVYIVTAKGPGGSGRDTLRLRVLPETVDMAFTRPQVAFAAAFVSDSVGVAASHLVTSTGGPVTGYAVVPALPPGLSLNISTGAITGTPSKAYGRDDYAVIAFGPGGRDTATLSLAVHARAATDPDAPRLALLLRFGAARVESAIAPAIAPPQNPLPSVTLKRMILVFRSTANDSLRDTVAAGTQGLPLKIDATRPFRKEYAMPKALRTWKVTARVFDMRDSLIFADSSMPGAWTGTTADTLLLFARYTGFRTVYALPDSLSRASDGKKWPIVFKRFTLQVGTTTVMDTSAATPGLAKELFIEYPYLVSGANYSLTHTFSGSVAGRADTVLFKGSGGYAPEHYPVSVPLNYVGPTNLP